MCDACRADPHHTALIAQSKASQAEVRLQKIRLVCGTCAKLPVHETGACDSVDCPTLYARTKASRELDDVTTIFENLEVTDEAHQTKNKKSKSKSKQAEPYLIL